MEKLDQADYRVWLHFSLDLPPYAEREKKPFEYYCALFSIQRLFINFEQLSPGMVTTEKEWQVLSELET